MRVIRIFFFATFKTHYVVASYFSCSIASVGKMVMVFSQCVFLMDFLKHVLVSRQGLDSASREEKLTWALPLCPPPWKFNPES